MQLGEKAARIAIADRLQGGAEPVMLWSLSITADTAAKTAGRKRQLFPSLYDYEDLLPSGWRPTWLGTGPTSDRILYAVPEGWKASPSRSLLLGGGTLCER